MPNVKQIIDGHNKTTVAKNEKQQQGEIKNNCNCRKKEECPLNGYCLTKEIVYQAKVTTQEKSETYIGLRYWYRFNLKRDGGTISPLLETKIGTIGA